MNKLRKAARILLTAALTLSGCASTRPQPVVLSGNTIQAIYSSSSAGKKVLSYYRIGPEAMAKLLEKAERCTAK